jgi:Ca2+-binding RTX toxin-like protein
MAVTQLQVTQLYLAYFGRPPDFDGMNYYLAQPNATVQSVAAAFSASPESQALYGSTFGAAQINAIYQNLFNRDAEPGGISYWSTEVNSGRLSPAMAAYAILIGAQNADATTVAAKMTVATNWLLNLDTSSEIVNYSGAAAVAVARDYLHTITTAAQAAAQTTAIINAKIAEAVVAHTTGGLTISSDIATVNEGSTVYFTMQTIGVAAGTEYAYTITGVSAADVVGGQLSGVATIDVNGRAVVSVSLVADALTDAGESVTLTSAGVVKTVAVNDTSTTPIPTYVITNDAAVGGVNEGTTVLYTITTTNVAPGTELNYSLTGTGLTASDVVGGHLTGTVTVGNDGKAIVQVTYAADYFGNEGNETVRLNVQTATSDVIVKEVAATYALEVNRVTVDEGAAVTYTLVSTNVAPGTQVAYTISLTGGATAADIGGVPLTGFATIGADGRANVVVNATADLTTDPGEKVKVIFNVPTSLVGATLTTADVTINDTSITPPPSYSITPTASSVNEGSSVSFNIQTTNVAPGTVLAYTLSGTGITTADIGGGSLTGTATVGPTGAATVTVTLVADSSFLEGNETLTLTLDGKGVSANVQVVDTSVLQTQWTLTAAQDTVAGSVQADTITAFNATLNAGDILAGNTQPGGSVDTLRVFVDSAMGAAGANYSGFEMSGIEVLEVTSDDLLAAPGNGATFELSSSTGITKLISKNSSQATTFNQITGLATVELQNLTNPANASVTLQFQDTVVAGATTLDMNVINSNVGVVTIGSVGDANGGIETLNLQVSGGNSTITTINSDITTLDLNGATVGSPMTNNLTITNSLNATITTITGGDATGNVNLTVSGAAQGVAITTGSGNDVLTGSAFGDTIKAGGGANVVTAGAGDDNVTVGSGSGTQIVFAGTGADTVVVNSVNSTFVDGDTGSDTITVNGGTGSGTHTITAGTGDNNVTVTGNGATNITALGGADTITIHGTGIVGTVSSGAGADVITTDLTAGAMLIDAGADNDSITTGDAADSITIGSGLDTVVANGGNDTIAAGGGNFDAHYDGFPFAKQDVINGGAGNDELQIDAGSIDYNFNQVQSVEILTLLTAGSTTLGGDGQVYFGYGSFTNYAQAAGINTINTATGNDSIDASSFWSIYTDGKLTVNVTNSGDDTIRTGQDSDTINASGAGNIDNLDVIDAGGGTDVLNLNGDTTIDNDNLDNIDVINLASGGAGVNQYSLTFDANNAVDTGTLVVNGGTLTSGETVMFNGTGANYNVSVTSGAAADTITDGNGNDYINSGSNDDTIVLNAGNNVVLAGAGADTATLGTGTDNVSMEGGNDTVNVATGNFTGADVIDGGLGANVLNVTGGSADAQYAGTTNMQTLNVIGVVTTTLGVNAEHGSTGIRTVNLDAAGGSVLDATGYVTAGITVNGGVANDTISTGGGGDLITAGTGDDVISTNGGNDTVMMGAGTESINLGSGTDVVIVAGTELDATDSINGGLGTDEVQLNNMTVAGAVVATVNLTNVTGIEGYRFTGSGDRTIGTDADANSITFTNGAVDTLTLVSLNASAITDPDDSLTVTWAASVDADYSFSVTGSAVNDVFIKSPGGNNNNITMNAGNGNDILRIDSGDLGANIAFNGEGGFDTIQLTGGATALQDDDLFAVTGTEHLQGYGTQLWVTLGAEGDEAGINTLTSDANGSNVLLDPMFNNNLTVNLGTGTDWIKAGNSTSTVTFNVTSADLTAADTLTGGSGAADVANVSSAGPTADLTNVKGIETYNAIGGGANNGLMFVDASFTGVASNIITVNAAGMDPYYVGPRTFTLAGGAAVGPHRFSVQDSQGNDALTTGSGNDTIHTGYGTDTIVTNDGNDVIDQNATVSNYGYWWGKNIDSGAGADTVSLNNDGVNTIVTGAGADVVTLEMRSWYVGGSTIDTGTENDSVTLTNGSWNNTVTTGSGSDTVTINVSSGTNYIDTGADADVIVSNSGNNRLTGGLAADSITLGSGSEVVRYTSTLDSWGLAANRDTITNFDVAGNDSIMIESAMLGLGVASVNFAGNAVDSQEAQLAIALSAGDSIADWVYDQSTHRVLVDLNDDGQLNAQDLAITMVNVAGNDMSNADMFVGDTIAPAVPTMTIVDNVAPDTTNVVGGDSTNDPSLDVSGAAETGATVKLYDNNVYTGLSTVAVAGAYSFAGVAVANGAHSFTVTATDASLNISTSAATAFTVDTVAPTLTITDDEAGVANIAGGTVTFTFQFSEAVTGFTVGDVVLANGAAGTFTAVDADTYTLVVTPSANYEGNLTVDVAAGAAADAAGNLSLIAATDTQVVDTLAPVSLGPVTLTTDTGTAGDNITSNAALTFAAPEGGATVTYSVNGGAYSPTYTPGSLADGAYTVNVRQTDAAGNVGPAAAISFVKDTAAPVLQTITDNQALAVQAGTPVVFTFTFSEAVTGFALADLTVTGQLAASEVIGGSGAVWTLTVTPAAATDVGTLSVTYNGAGNVMDIAGTVDGTPLQTVQTQSYDTYAPMVTTLMITNDTNPPAGAVTSDPSLTIDTDETGDTVTYEYNVNGNGFSSTYDTSLLIGDGVTNNTVVVRATDDVGNLGPNSATLNFFYDAPPVVVAFTPVDESGAASASANLTIQLSETVSFVNAGAVTTQIQLIDLTNSNSITAVSSITLGTTVFANDTVIIDPTLNLISGHHYAVTMANGTLQDVATVQVIGWNDAETWDFVAA